MTALGPSKGQARARQSCTRRDALGTCCATVEELFGASILHRVSDIQVQTRGPDSGSESFERRSEVETSHNGARAGQMLQVRPIRAEGMRILRREIPGPCVWRGSSPSAIRACFYRARTFWRLGVDLLSNTIFTCSWTQPLENIVAAAHKEGCRGLLPVTYKFKAPESVPFVPD